MASEATGTDTSRVRILAIVLAFWVTPVVFGCGGSQLKTVDGAALEMKTATSGELVSYINDDSERVTGLKGKLTLGIQRKPGDSVEKCRGVIVSENGVSDRPGLYLKGYRRLLPTFFTLVSDGREFWLHIPRRDVVFTGPVEFSWNEGEDAAFYLKPVDLFRALYVNPIDVSAFVDVANEDSLYVVSIHAEGGGSIERVLWVERVGFSVVREVFYDSTGSETLEIRRTEMADIDGRVYPSRFVLRDRLGESTVYLEFNAMTLNPGNVNTGMFRFDIPDGVETRHVIAGVPRT
jgi:hypothetical protein